jgi:uncharacterized protein YbaP (TraB family)
MMNKEIIKLQAALAAAEALATAEAEITRLREHLALADAMADAADEILGNYNESARTELSDAVAAYDAGGC